jgi:NAD(P)-dependent dehydrogenase (short-subunit alcohol dehydrogenase family)
MAEGDEREWDIPTVGHGSEGNEGAGWREIGLSRTAAVEYAKKGIRVNVICSGFIDTGLTKQVVVKKAHLEEKHKSLIPAGRFGEEGEVSESVIWLLSDASSFVSGHALIVDGGASA